MLLQPGCSPETRPGQAEGYLAPGGAAWERLRQRQSRGNLVAVEAEGLLTNCVTSQESQSPTSSHAVPGALRP